MVTTQLSLSEILDKKIDIVQSRQGINTKQDTIIYILEKALEKIKIEEIKPGEIQEINIKK